jgi:crotonyl-CoA carboxylase/reductase
MMTATLVRDVMHRGVIICWDDELLGDVARRLVEYDISAIFVMDESGRAKGIISRTDLAQVYVQKNWQMRTANDIMSPQIITITGDIPLKAAVQIMLDNRIHRLLIVQGGHRPNRPVGVLSLSDVMYAMAEEDANSEP